MPTFDTTHNPTRAQYAPPAPELHAEPPGEHARYPARSNPLAAHSPGDLLHALALLNFSPTRLARELDVSPFALLPWYESEKTQSQLDRFEAFECRMLQLRAYRSRRLSIENLEHILETSEDLVEKRRTATTLLRILGKPIKDDTDLRGGTDLRDVRKTEPASGSGRADGTRHPPKEPPHFVGSANAEPPSAHAEPGSASDHGAGANCEQTDRTRPSAQTPSEPRSESNTADGASQPPQEPPHFLGSANAEPPSASEQEQAHAGEQEPADPGDHLDWNAFTTWPKSREQPQAAALHASAGALTPPSPHQRE